jgi:hypothetical protein
MKISGHSAKKRPDIGTFEMGAHASGVWFAASRRKLRQTIFCPINNT